MRAALSTLLLVSCAAPELPTGTVEVPGGTFWAGSDLSERAAAMRGPQSEDAVARLRAEPRRRQVTVAAFRIMKAPVTHGDFHRFVLATGAAEPWIDRARWDAFETGYDYKIVQRYAWHNGAPPDGKKRHPVVLVDHGQAAAYCAWWGRQLPTEMQWERAARGDEGQAYPWGSRFEAGRANTLESRRGGTSPVGRTASPFGARDMAGNVFEWTRTPGDQGYVVKGGSWSSDAASARAAARHTRQADLRHVALGFRCVIEAVKPHK